MLLAKRQLEVDAYNDIQIRILKCIVSNMIQREEF